MRSIRRATDIGYGGIRVGADDGYPGRRGLTLAGADSEELFAGRVWVDHLRADGNVDPPGSGIRLAAFIAHRLDVTIVACPLRRGQPHRSPASPHRHGPTFQADEEVNGTPLLVNVHEATTIMARESPRSADNQSPSV